MGYCFLHIFIGEMFVHITCPFKKLDCFILLSFKTFLYNILNTSPFFRWMFCKYLVPISFYFLASIIGRVEVFNFDELPIITNYFCCMLFVLFSYLKKKKKVDLTQSHEMFFLCFVFSCLLYMVLRYGSRFIFYI